MASNFRKRKYLVHEPGEVRAVDELLEPLAGLLTPVQLAAAERAPAADELLHEDLLLAAWAGDVSGIDPCRQMYTPCGRMRGIPSPPP